MFRIMDNLETLCISKNQNNLPAINIENELGGCQIETKRKIVKLLWDILHQYRNSINEVGDFGAGDGKFALEGNYKHYTGIEIDKSQNPSNDLPDNARLRYDCILNVKEKYDACIGNPPYFRHHAINAGWKESAAKLINNETGFIVNKLANLFVYFLWLSLLRTKPEGIIALIVPYEWVSRPSCKSLRDFIIQNNWSVNVYRFENEKEIFPGVLTTSSITVIDKSKTNGKWDYFDISKDLKIKRRNGITGTGERVLPYENGGYVYAKRGFSPGSQKIFALTENERIHQNIKLTEVIPCVTSFKDFPAEIKVLDNKTFNKYFVKAGKKCWLIKTDGKLSDSVLKYFERAPEKEKKRYTCRERDIWYSYKSPEAPKILYASGFIRFGPKVVENKVGAVPLGSAHGILSENGKLDLKKLVSYLSNFDFESRVVRHAHTLIKVEVRQMNSVINDFLRGSNGQ
jgi:hypothetical protein